MIRLENLTKVFETAQGPVTAVDHVSFELAAGEVCVLLGPSGCGKTTTLKMINRLLQPTGGKIFIDGKDSNAVDPIQLRRGIGYVIQQVGLFPNKTVADNICVVPDLLGWDRGKSRRRAAELLELVGLAPGIFLQRYPRELSGGQQQRIGVLRALAADPPVMLMDEPFGAIDPINRAVIQDEFLRIQRTLKKTVLVVSHDLDEAVKLADRIAIFNAGRLEQYASPDTLLAAPANDFIRSFLGSDRALKRLTLVRVAQALLTDGATLAAATPLAEARRRLATDDGLIVVDPQGRPLGLLRRERAAGEGLAGEHVEPLPATLKPEDDLRTAVALLFAHDLPVLPCVDGEGRLLGVVSHRAIARVLSGKPR